MYAIDDDIRGSDTVTLCVDDPIRSHEFYQDLFGLVMREKSPPGANRLLETPGDQSGVSILLRRRDGDGGPLWLSVEVASVSEVLDVYLLAIMMGAKAHLPRKRGARWSTVVTDPDGNHISIWTKVDDEEAQNESALRPHRWQWRLSQSEGSDRTAPAAGANEKEDGAEGCRGTNRRLSAMGRLDGVPGRGATGADRVDRRRGVCGGARIVPATGRARCWKERSK